MTSRTKGVGKFLWVWGEEIPAKGRNFLSLPFLGEQMFYIPNEIEIFINQKM